MQRAIVRLGAQTVFLLALASCAARSAGPDGRQAVPEPVLDSLLAEIRGKVAERHGRPSREDIKVVRSESSVVPGLVYYWADYVPPNTAHINYRTVVGARSGGVVVLREPSDWARAATEWLPVTPDAALTACQEALHVSTHRERPLVPPQVYRGPGSLMSADVRNSRELQTRLSPPAVRTAPGGWSARFWAIGVRVIAEYDCEIAPETVKIRELQALTGYITTPVI